MFRHKGKSRTYVHNLRVASLLSLVAGVVNSTGFLAVRVLTTNVTGHFAFFAADLSGRDYGAAVVYLFYIVSFLAGAFVSNLLIEIVSRAKPSLAYACPLIVEMILLTLMGGFGNQFIGSAARSQFMAGSLLLAMGLQNALVTNVSQSVVRTTHLTGLFTDLGIELSQLFFYRKAVEQQQLSKSIYLKLAIISCFFFGCLMGGFLFRSIGVKTLLLAAALLSMALLYDPVRLQYYHLKRKSQFR